MIVVADTSPINYLVLVEQVHLLERLYRKVVLPGAVFGELQAEGTPEAVRQWVKKAPNWLEVVSIDGNDLLDLPGSLHRGEKEAIGLARKLAADYVILDDRDGRRVAQDLGLNVTGTLGVLGRADEQGFSLLYADVDVETYAVHVYDMRPRLRDRDRRRYARQHGKTPAAALQPGGQRVLDVSR